MTLVPTSLPQLSTALHNKKSGWIAMIYPFVLSVLINRDYSLQRLFAVLFYNGKVSLDNTGAEMRILVERGTLRFTEIHIAPDDLLIIEAEPTSPPHHVRFAYTRKMGSKTFRSKSHYHDSSSQDPIHLFGGWFIIPSNTTYHPHPEEPRAYFLKKSEEFDELPESIEASWKQKRRA